MAHAIQKITLNAARDTPFDKLVLSQDNIRPELDGDGAETGLYRIPAGTKPIDNPICPSYLMGPPFDVGVALARLDERIARSPIGAGFIERQNFADACASLWIDGELVHLEDLVLHDATRDIRTPIHELAIARDVLRTRRRIAAQPPDWAVSAQGICVKGPLEWRHQDRRRHDSRRETCDPLFPNQPTLEKPANSSKAPAPASCFGYHSTLSRN